MLLLELDNKSPKPKHAQIFEQIRTKIQTRLLRPGERLPSTRHLAETLGIHRSTVAVAYQELWALGFIDISPGARPRVRERMQLVTQTNRAEKALINWSRVSSRGANSIWEAHCRLGSDVEPSAGNNSINFRALDMDARLFPVEQFRACVNRVIKKRNARRLKEEFTLAFTNCYEDTIRAEAYAQLEFANTYHLAFRDLPQIVREHVSGTQAIDFGCGTGRSTRFVRQLGFTVTGVDIAPEMIAKARQLDPGGDYRLVKGDDLSEFETGAYDLVLSAFTFDNIPGFETKVRLFRDLRALLKISGKLVSIVSSPEIYLHDWASFSTKDYPENRFARSGDIVRIITTDFPDRRPAEDILCTDKCYRDIYHLAGLEVAAMYKPLAKGDEPYQWVNETEIAPWVIYVLAPQSGISSEDPRAGRKFVVSSSDSRISG